MLDMGFIHDVRRVIKALPTERQTLFFSATMPPEIAKLAHDILTDKPTAYLATMRPDGRMSVTPMGMLFDGEHIRLSTTKDRMKYRNLLADDRLTVCMPHRNNPNRYVEVRGRAVLADDPDLTFIDSVARAYMGVDVYPFDRPGQERVTITVIAEHVFSTHQLTDAHRDRAIADLEALSAQLYRRTQP